MSLMENVAFCAIGYSLKFKCHSSLLRSVVIHKSPVPHRWVCANVELAGARQMLTAVARFTYPVAGQIIFRQDADDPFSDTTVLVDGLLYSDGTKVSNQVFMACS